MAITTNLVARQSFALGTPITVGDEEISELSFRKPTIEELCRIGAIQLITSDGEGAMDYGRLNKYMSVLGNVPPSTIKKLEPSDFIGCAQFLVATFFLPSTANRT